MSPIASPRPSSFSAVLLAGGKSTRMRRDKALLEIGGEMLWQRQLRQLEELAPREIFVAGPFVTAHISLADAKENAGPLGGLVAALRKCSTPRLLALALDLPKMSAHFLQRLLDHSSSEQGVVYRRGDLYEPLAAIYPVEFLPLAEAALHSGDYSLQPLVRRASAAGLLIEIEAAPEEAALFANMNTPEDFQALTAGSGSSSASKLITRYTVGVAAKSCIDQVAIEEPLEIRIEGHSVAVVMRTPGHDRELAAGFLVSENLIRSVGDLFEITLCGDADEENVVNVTLHDPATFDPAKLTRHVFSSSSCGICSKASIDAVRQAFPPIADDSRISPETLLTLPALLRAEQKTFEQTGGLHACAIFDLLGQIQSVREDVGRHNALDKLIGCALLENRLALRARVLLLSGRVSFEMMQKALAAGIPIVAAISAPTSLAIEFAQENQQTLVGFLRGETMNIYAGAERLESATPGSARF